MTWAGGDLRRSLSNLLLKAGAALGSDQVAQGLIHSGLEKFQGWRQLSLLGQPVLLLGCRPGGKGFLYIQSEPLIFYARCLSSSRHLPPWRAWLHLLNPLPTGVQLLWVPRSLPCPRLTKPCSRSFSPECKCSSPSHPEGLH